MGVKLCKDRKLIISGLLGISIAVLFFPWFYFSRYIDYSNGWQNVAHAPFIPAGLVAAIFLVWKSKWSSFIVLLIALLSCLYLFFTWHIQTITGELNLRVSYETVHYGFYITFIASLLAMVTYIDYNIILKNLTIVRKRK